MGQLLNEDRMKILQHLKEEGEQETPDIREQADLDYNHPNSLNNSLNKLEEQGYVQSINSDGQSDTWRLKRDGRKELESNKVEPEEHLEFGELIRRFEEYLHEKMEDEIAEALKGGRLWINVNFSDLEKYDVELADSLLENPDTALEAIEEAVENHSLAGRENSLDARITELPEEETLELSKIYHSDIGRLVAVEGIVTHNGIVKQEIYSAIFECSQCGDHYEKKQDSAQLKSPYKCDCGSRKFEPVEKLLRDKKIIQVQERTSKPNPRKRQVVLYGSLARSSELEKTSLGSLIRVNGIVRERPLKKKSSKMETYLEASSIAFKDKNELEEIDEETKQKVRELAEDPYIKSRLKDSVARGRIGGLDRVKEAYLLYRLGKLPDGNIHLLIAGEPDVGKSELVSTSEGNLPRTLYVDLQGSTDTGITASLTEDKQNGGYEVTAKALVRTDDGFFIGDEAGKFGSDYSCFNTPMQKGEVRRSAGDKEITLPANTSVCLLMNPSRDNNRRWDGIPSVEDLPISSQDDLVSRFDLKVGIPRQDIQGEDGLRRELEKADRVLSGEGDPDIKLEVFKAYLSVAEEVEPELTEDAYGLLKRLYVGLSLRDYKISSRDLGAMSKIAKAYSRMRLEEEVSTERVEEAYEFWKECQATLYEDFRDEREEVSETTGFEAESVSKVGEALRILERHGGIMRKRELKQELELGGSESKEDTFFGELVEEIVGLNAVRESGQELVLEKDPDFLEGQKVAEIVEEEIR